jgi:hypothetical protein
MSKKEKAFEFYSGEAPFFWGFSPLNLERIPTLNKRL